MPQQRTDINQLILAYTCGETLSEEEYAILYEWRTASPENDALPEQFRDLHWIARELHFIDEFPAEPVWEKVAAGVRWKRYQYIGTRVGAAALVIAGVSLWPWGRAVHEPAIAARSASFSVRDTLQTRAGEHRDTRLPDGSHVVMGYHSSLTYYQDSLQPSRKAALEGQAYFNIYPNDTLPFHLQLSHVNLEVLGTSFYARSNEQDNAAEVLLFSGRLRLSGQSPISGHDTMLVLEPFQRARMTNGIIRIDSAQDSTMQLSIEKEKVVVRFLPATPVQTVLDWLSLWYEKPILNPKKIKVKPIQWLISYDLDEPLDSVLEDLNIVETNNACLKEDKGSIILLKK